MPAPSLQGSSAIVAATAATSVTPVLPAHILNDILIIRAWARTISGTPAGQPLTVLTAGWAQGGLNNRGAVSSYTWYWKRAGGSGEANGVVSVTAGASADKYAQAHVIRGCKTVGQAWEAILNATGTADPATLAGVTTLGLDRLIALLFGDEDNLDTQMIVTATDPASLGTSTSVNNRYVVDAAGSDGGVGIAAAAKASAGATGTISADLNGASRPGWGATAIAFIPIPPGLALRNYRFRNDDGDETTATWIAAENTAITLPDNAPQFRVRLDVLGSTIAGGTDRLKLQYRLNGVSWLDVLTSSNVIKIIASPNVADGAATTDQLSGSGTFAAGTIDEAQGYVEAVNLALNGHTEVEFSVQLLEFDVAPGDVIELRLVQKYTDADVIVASTNVPTINIGGGSTPIAGSDSGSGADASSLGAGIPVSDVNSRSEASALVSTIPATDQDATPSETTTLSAVATVADLNASVTESALVTVPKAGTDAGSGSDASALAAILAALDANGVVEATLLAAGIPVSDTGAGADSAQATIPKSGSDSGAGTDATSLAASASTPDTGAGSDTATEQAAIAASDVNSRSELGVLAALFTLTDQDGSPTEAAQILAGILGTDVGSDSETGSLIVLASASDVGSGAQSGFPVFLAAVTQANGVTTEVGIQTVPVSASDSGTGSEVGSPRVVISVVDQDGTVTEIGSVLAAFLDVFASDSGSGSQNASLLAAISGSQTGAGSDVAIPAVAVLGSDLLQAVEQGGIGAVLPGLQLVTVGESAALAARVASADAAVAAELSTLLVAMQDFGSSTEIATFNAQVAVVDTALVSQLASLIAQAYGTDEATSTETAYIILKGFMPSIMTGHLLTGGHGILSEGATGRILKRG